MRRTDCYIIPGMVAEKPMIEQAVKRKNEGKTTMVHYHGAGQTCTQQCTLYEPDKSDADI